MNSVMPLPKYHQVYLVLREQLHEGKFVQGLPGELALMQQFSVARVTVRSISASACAAGRSPRRADCTASASWMRSGGTTCICTSFWPTGRRLSLSASSICAGLARPASIKISPRRCGEAAVLAAYPKAMILRPSVIFGNEDGFFNRFAAMSRMGPILPLVGGSTRFQPVYVEDVAAAAVLGVTGKAHGTYELGGPDALSLTAIIHHMLAVVQRRRLVANLPFWVGAVMAGVLDMLSALTLGLFSNGVITTDQARQLRQDNVVQAGAKTLADLGINAANFDAIIPEYLWRYRATGQFAAIRDSAKHLRKG